MLPEDQHGRGFAIFGIVESISCVIGPLIFDTMYANTNQIYSGLVFLTIFIISTIASIVVSSVVLYAKI